MVKQCLRAVCIVEFSPKHEEQVYCSARCNKKARQARHKSTYGKNTISKSKKWRVFKRDNYICQLCYTPMDMVGDPNGDWAPSIDHILEILLGGTNDISNLQSAHRYCNSKRSTELAAAIQKRDREEAV